MKQVIREVEQVVLKALAKDAKERFASIEQFAQALQEAMQPPTVPQNFPITPASPFVTPISSMPIPASQSLSALPADTDMPVESVSTSEQSQQRSPISGTFLPQSGLALPASASVQTDMEETQTAPGMPTRSPLISSTTSSTSDSLTLQPPHVSPAPSEAASMSTTRPRSLPVVVILMLLTLLILTGGSIGISDAVTGDWPWAPKTSIQVSASIQMRLTSAQLEATSTILNERLTAFGFHTVHISEVTSGNQPALQVDIPHFSRDESSALDSLLATGQLEFWTTGSTPLQDGTTFDPSQFPQNTNGVAPFTGTDLDPSQIRVETNPQNGQPQMNFAMKGHAVSKFRTFTQQNGGNYLTITLDRKAIESAVIQTAINGPGVIAGNFTSQEANVLASIFKYPSLPVALREASEIISTAS